MTEATIEAEAPAPSDTKEGEVTAPVLWEEVQAEHFSMLRLAPLPTDRATGGRPLRFVEFGRAERNSKDFSLLRMSYHLPGQKTRKEQNHLDIWVDHANRAVRVGPESGLQIEPWNRGLGRFMVAQGIHWAQKRWSEYKIAGTALANKDALNEDTRLRRDHFLKTNGFEVVYADPQHLKGSIKDAKVGSLNNTWNTGSMVFGKDYNVNTTYHKSDLTSRCRANCVDRDTTSHRIRHYRSEIGDKRYFFLMFLGFHKADQFFNFNNRSLFVLLF